MSLQRKQNHDTLTFVEKLEILNEIEKRDNLVHLTNE